MSAPAADRDPYRWTVFSGLFGLYFAFGVVAMSIPPIVGEVRADLGLSRGGMGLALGAWQLVYIATAPPAGRVVDRLGLRRSLAIGALVILASGLARASAGGLVGFWSAIALFGIGGPLISAGAPKVVSTWFSDEHERRFAVGAYNTAPVLGGMATLVLSNSVFMPLTGSWRLTVAFESAAMLVAVTAWLVVTRRKPPTAAMPAPGDGSGGLRSLLADPRVRTVLVLALGFFFIAHGLDGWLPSVLREHNGFSPMAAANWTAVSGAVGIVTSLTLPRRATRARLPILMAGTLVVVALGLMAVVVAPTFLVPVPMVAIGVRYALIPLTIVTLMDSPAVGPRNMGQAFGLFFAVAEVGGVTGPLIVGRVADTAVGFGGALVLVGAVCVLMLVAVARLSRLDADEVGSARAVTGS